MTKRLLIASRVVGLSDIATGIRRFTLRPERRELFPPSVAGSYVTVRHQSGLLRTYSLCGDADRRETFEFAVQREPDGRGGSMLFHDDIDIGDPVHVSYPIPSLVLAEDAPEHVFVAGGIGVTPFLPLALEVDRRGQRSVLHYAVRSRSQLAFLEEFAGIASLTVKVYVSSEGNRMRIDALLAGLNATAHLYACGPDRLLSAVSDACETMAVGPERIHLESFSGLDPAKARAGDPFTVNLRLSKREIAVPADKSMLQALNDAGVGVDYSCEGGVCGACRVTLVSGDVIHRDICLTDAARAETIITCVSRGRGIVTLQL
ncbi:PDR/VanB family oxidoreductase [Subtercola frigoramans]|uniref:Vanillate O-demethylase ferredoxin subunit n=1 Tax=Subtercola frigoramans TaxID=120298 RepID=A0ABS2LA96_9MICO|nr:PDR/VanB family oxidoreductase [Subtercola frigoramans]MBM7473675.1 vanillate O-demethylase ferredoxin subunit [Subtercola frigoramans]